MAEAGDVVAGRYLLQERIGAGGMGVVWRAQDEVLHRQVAVKCARPDDPRSADKLKNEARNAAGLHHPNIVAVFDILDEGGTCWIVMEFVPSRSLAQIVLEDGPLTPERAGAIGGQIADALAKAHDSGVVHGDVTPENILVRSDGVAKLTDFGISRALWSEVTQQSRTGGMPGKAQYLPPEVAHGERPDKKSDMFSLGATIFTAVEGQSPYGRAENPMAYVGRARDGHIEEAHRAGPLAETLAALLDLEPKRRPGATKTRKLLTGAAPPPPHLQDLQDPPEGRTRVRPPFTIRLPKPRGRRRGVTVTAVALTAAVAVVAGVILWGPDWGDDGGSDGAGGDTGTRSSTGKPGAIGDESTADPCALMRPASLSRFGDTQLDPGYGELDRCDVLVQEANGDVVADVEINFSHDQDEFGGGVPVRRVGNVKVASMERDGDECLRFIATSDHKQIVVNGKREDSPAPDPCALADAATDYAVSVLDQGAVPRRPSPWPANSLARLDACTLLDTAALKRVPGLEEKPSDRSFADWNCEWSSRDDDAFVGLRFTQDNDLEDNGQRTSIAGTTSYVAPEEEGEDSCVVYSPHRTHTNSIGDRSVETFMLTVAEERQGSEKSCAAAKALSATVVENIAKRLPEK